MSYLIQGEFKILDWDKIGGVTESKAPTTQGITYIVSVNKENIDSNLLVSICSYNLDEINHEVTLTATIKNHKKNSTLEAKTIDVFDLNTMLISAELPIKMSEINNESGWLDDGALVIYYSISYGKIIEQHTNFMEYTWCVNDFDPLSYAKSPTMKFNSGVYHLEQQADPRSLNYKLIADELNAEQEFSIEVTIKNTNESENKQFQRNCNFKLTGDIARIQIQLPISELDKGYLIDNKLSVIIKFDKKIDNVVSSFLPPPPPPPPGIFNSQSQINKPDASALPYAGLKNQGATCYLNSYLQVLFNLNAFRKLVFEIPTICSQNPEIDVVLNLQRLFCRMQLVSEPSKSFSTRPLTRSFGWDDFAGVYQQDIQELSRVLLDSLRMKTLGTPLEGRIDALFQGRTSSFIKCINVDYKSGRPEDVMELILQVKGVGSIEGSFERFVQTERLEGANQYDAGGEYGKQDAEMGVEIEKLPPVLQLNLQRYEYDWNFDSMVKNTDRLSFGDTLDLSEYTKSEKDIYSLFAVLVHTGNIASGHYFAYIKKEGNWCLFNDERVTKSDEKTAIEGNFGGTMKANTAYMLVYIRNCDSENIFKEVSKDEIPEHVLEYVELNEDDDSVIKKKAPPKPVQFEVVGEDSLIENARKGAISFVVPDLMKTVTLMSDETVEKLYEKVSEEFRLNSQNITLWQRFSSGSPTVELPRSETYVDEIKKKSLFVQNNIRNGATLYLFAFISDRKQPLHFIQSVGGSKSTQINELIQPALSLLKIQNAEIFEASNSNALRPINAEGTIESEFLSDGDVLVVCTKTAPECDQMEDNPIEEADEEGVISFKSMCAASQGQTLSDFLLARESQILVDLFDYETSEKKCRIKFPPSITYAQLLQLIKHALKTDSPIKIFKADTNNLPSLGPVLYSRAPTAGAIFPASSKARSLFYSFEEDTPGCITYVAEYSSSASVPERRIRIQLERGSKCSDFIERLRSKGIEYDCLVCSLVQNNRFKAILSATDSMPEASSVIRVDRVDRPEGFYVRAVVCEADAQNIAKPTNISVLIDCEGKTISDIVEKTRKLADTSDDDPLPVLIAQELAYVNRQNFVDPQLSVSEAVQHAANPVLYIVRKSKKPTTHVSGNAMNGIKIFN